MPSWILWPGTPYKLNSYQHAPSISRTFPYLWLTPKDATRDKIVWDRHIIFLYCNKELFLHYIHFTQLMAECKDDGESFSSPWQFKSTGIYLPFTSTHQMHNWAARRMRLRQELCGCLTKAADLVFYCLKTNMQKRDFINTSQGQLFTCTIQYTVLGDDFPWNVHHSPYKVPDHMGVQIRLKQKILTKMST